MPSTKVLIGDREFGPVLKAGAATGQGEATSSSIIDDPRIRRRKATRLGNLDYEDFIAAGDPEFTGRCRETNGTPSRSTTPSGTTGNPKGVVYHHRGAALMCYANTIPPA